MADVKAKPILTPVTESKPALPLNVTMARQNTEYFTAPQFPELNSLTKPFNYILAEDGLYEVRNVRAGWFINKIGPTKTKVPGFCKHDIKPAGIPRYGKIPYELFQEVYAFFKEICDDSKDEAYVQTFWDPEKEEYFNHVPVQEVSGASVRFTRDQELEEKCVLVLETHSHNSMNAFFSGTDDRDEKSDRFFGVMGKLNTAQPEFKYSYRCGKERVIISLDSLFEGAPQATFPEGWKEKIKKAKATIVQTGAHYAGYGHWSKSPSSYGISGQYSSYGKTYQGNYGGKTLQKKQSGKKEREEVKKAAKEAEAAIADFEELFSDQDPDIQSFLTENSIEVDEENTAPFFEVSSTGYSVEEDDFLNGDDLKDIVSDTLLALQVRGEDMSQEERIKVLNDFVGSISDEDVSCLSFLLAEYGHSDEMIKQIKAYASCDEEEVAV